jgi:hypothetical protein
MTTPRLFSQMSYDEQDAQITEAIQAGCALNASELCMWFEQPESEHTEFIAAVERFTSAS